MPFYLTVLRNSFFVRAPASDVFYFLTDHTRYARWIDFVQQVTYPEGRKTGIGAKSRWITRIAGINGHLDVETKEWVANKYVRVENTGTYFHNSGGSFSLKEGEEGTIVDFEIHYDVPFSFLGKLLDRLLISRELESGFTRGFQRMKDALEGANPMRVPTGVLGLDILLDRGLPKGSWVLVVGPPGSGKSAFGRQFLYTAASRGNAAVYLATNDSIDSARLSIASLGSNAPELDRIEFIDCYSWRNSDRHSIDIKNLTGTNISILEFFRKNIDLGADPCLVIDSFTDFLLNNEVAAALTFLSLLKSKLQEKGVTTLVLLEDGIHDKSTAVTIEYLLDGTIVTKIDETGRYLMVKRMAATPVDPVWRKFEIKKGTLALAAVDFANSFGEQRTRSAELSKL